MSAPTMTNKRLEKIWFSDDRWGWRVFSETVYLVDLACPQCNKRRKPKNYKKHTVRFAGWDAVVCPECEIEIPRIGYGSKGKKIDRTTTRARYASMCDFYGWYFYHEVKHRSDFDAWQAFLHPDLPVGVYNYLEVADFTTFHPDYL